MRRSLLKLSCLFVLGASTASAATVSALYYDMQNGGSGAFTYYDDSYTCVNLVACSANGTQGTDYSSLFGGKGDLTDGVIASANWFSTPAPYVGWQNFDPLIQFHFAPGTSIHSVTIFFDDSGGAGTVSPPASFDFTNGGPTQNFLVGTNPSPTNPYSQTFNVALGATTQLDITSHRRNNWQMISEIQFDGSQSSVPEPASGLLAIAGLGLVPLLRRRFR